MPFVMPNNVELVAGAVYADYFDDTNTLQTITIATSPVYDWEESGKLTTFLQSKRDEFLAQEAFDVGAGVQIAKSRLVSVRTEIAGATYTKD